MRHILLGLLATVVVTPLSTYAQAQQRPAAPTTSAADPAAIEAAQREAEINRLFSNAAPDRKLVCLSVDDFIIKYSKTMRLSLNTEKKRYYPGCAG